MRTPLALFGVRLSLQTVLHHLRGGLTCAWFLAATPLVHAQLTVGQTDTFEGGTTAGWANGGAPGSQALIVASGGPAGVNDHFLQITSTGSGAGGKLTAFNRTQWAGDFNGAGVAGIDLDLKGFSSPGGQALSIRIALKSDILSSSPGYVSTTPISLPVDGQWHHATLSLSDLTPVGSPPPLSSLLDSAPEVRILHAVAANTVHGDDIAAQIGVDNITAVPEPSSALAAVLCVTGFAVLRRVLAAKPSDESGLCL